MNIFDRHQRIALQVSGGKDSLACLFLMQEYWDRMTVYWVNSGDAFPETTHVMEGVRRLVPHFVEIDGKQPDVIRRHGIPSDMVPVTNTDFGTACSGQEVLIQDRNSCCARVFMLPMAERMIEDGITLVIRGQKNADTWKAPVESGVVEDGIEYLFPIQDWSDADVLEYLDHIGVTLPRYYQYMSEAPDCRTCSAFWSKGANQYLKQFHPEQYAVVKQRLKSIGAAMAHHIDNFNKEVE